MELREIRPNALVEHSERGVGQIISVEGSRVLISFVSDLTESVTVSMSTATTDSYRALPADGLESTFLHSPDDVISWVNSAPLRLIGATLTDLKDRKGKAGRAANASGRAHRAGCGMVDLVAKVGQACGKGLRLLQDGRAQQTQ